MFHFYYIPFYAVRHHHDTFAFFTQQINLAHFKKDFVRNTKCVKTCVFVLFNIKNKLISKSFYSSSQFDLKFKYFEIKKSSCKLEPNGQKIKKKNEFLYTNITLHSTCFVLLRLSNRIKKVNCKKTVTEKYFSCFQNLIFFLKKVDALSLIELCFIEHT